jgi:hypothetical protein
MAICQCLKVDGKPCTREAGTKSGQNPSYCWQHQSCKSSTQVTKKIQTPQKIQVPQKTQKVEPAPIKTLPHFNDNYVKGLPDVVIKTLIQMAQGCPRNKFISPKTGKCVAITSPTGKIIVQELMS